MGLATAVYASRNVLLYDAPFETTTTFPANTVEWGTTWGNGWVDRGYTQEGVTMMLSLEREEIVVDQLLDPVLLPASARDIRLQTNLAEFTGTNLSRGFGQGTVSTTAAGASTKGYTDTELTEDIAEDFRSWGCDFKKPYDGEAIRAIGWRGLAIGDVEAVFGQVDDNVKVPLDVRFLPDDSSTPARIFLVRDIIPATA